MSNLMRNDLTIEGANVKQVLDTIGFNPDGVPIQWGAEVQPDNIAVLIDFNRIVPQPEETPSEGWRKWGSDNWGASPYDGAEPGDILELTDNKVRFKFYTRWTSAFPVIEALAKQFPEFTIRLRSREILNHLSGEAAWRNGFRTLYVPMFDLKTNNDSPACDPVTDKIRTMAAQLIEALGLGCTPEAVEAVAATIAASGHPVKVEFETNDDGSRYLYIDADADEYDEDLDEYVNQVPTSNGTTACSCIRAEQGGSNA
jgi:hypothetical protein